MKTLLPSLVLTCGLWASGCGTTDGPSSDGTSGDGGAADGGTADGGTADGGTADGGTADGGKTDGGSDGGWSDGVDGEVVAAARADLRLKRWRQLTLDLEGALVLPADEICRETGLYDCTELHTVAMGGVSIPSGVYNPVDSVSSITGFTAERMVLQACFRRLQLDLEAEEPVVFTAVDLTGTTLDDGGESQIQDLTRRFLARDPLPEETAALAGLHADVVASGASNADWAVLACYALGTTTEALTY